LDAGLGLTAMLAQSNALPTPASGLWNPSRWDAAIAHPGSADYAELGSTLLDTMLGDLRPMMGVGARATEDAVVTGATVEIIRTIPAIKNIIAAAGIDHVIAIAAQQSGTAGGQVGDEPVITVSTKETIGTIPAVESIIAIKATNSIIPGIAVDRIVGSGPRQ
jgi:hypothetical protein